MRMESYLRNIKMIVNINSDIKYRLSKKEVEKNLIEIKYTFETNKFIEDAIKINFTMPYIDCAGCWTPTSNFNRSINPDWSSLKKSMTAKSAPVSCLFSENSKNRLTVALSEIRKAAFLLIGINEETSSAICNIEIPSSTFEDYETYSFTILIDTRDIHYSLSLDYVSNWWENTCNLKPMTDIPDTREMVYSTWYSFHQNLKDTDIENECKIAAELGLKTIIVDDGWQTSDNNRGYAYCGDWEIEKTKFRNFREHVKKVHSYGMRYMLWFSVPFIGKKSSNWEKFKDKLLYVNDHLETGVLDPRYKEVRTFITETFTGYVKDYNLDGLKLDFIDMFLTKKETPPYNSEMDISDVQDGLNIMLNDIKENLLKLKSDILIEFRQFYIGPNIRQYGNIFRVCDCPNSAITNRVGITDLRLLSKNTAIHSDMLMWNLDEPCEITALQIISCLFSTIQFSVRLEELNQDQLKMITFWVNFINKNKKLLQYSQFIADEPHNLYPLIKVKDKTKMIAAIYSADKSISFEKDITTLIIANGSKSNHVIVLDCYNLCTLRIYDCCGNEIQFTHTLFEGCNLIKVPIGGMIQITKI
jgi:alpha-galactosidase